eukprot:10491-Heterococcus_DN1.PRE.1
MRDVVDVCRGDAVEARAHDASNKLLLHKHIKLCELFDYISTAGALPATMARRLFRQLVSGLSAIHAAGLVHRDLSLMNLLLDSEFSLKIADFGHSCAYTGPKGRGFAGAAGTNSYM